MATKTEQQPVKSKLFINGEVCGPNELSVSSIRLRKKPQFVDASDKKTFPLKSPWTHEVVAYGRFKYWSIRIRSNRTSQLLKPPSTTPMQQLPQPRPRSLHGLSCRRSSEDST